MSSNEKESIKLLEKWKKRLELVLLKRLPTSKTNPSYLHQAMRYSTLNGGKRIRGLLVYATGYLLGAEEKLLDAPASAIEAIQCFSLIHDDLPAIDNDDLRRGKPSCHIAFDEATAILAGDGLQMFAFEQLSKSKHSAEQRLAMIRILAEKSGSLGMIGGGSIELEISRKKASLEELKNLYWLKCGKLIHASVLLGAYGATIPNQNILSKLELFAYNLGVGYQISNDLLDALGKITLLGKKPKSDQITGRTTFVTEFGIDKSKQHMLDFFNTSIESLNGLDRTEPLHQIVLQAKKRSLLVF